jgi:hypothetical protein
VPAVGENAAIAATQAVSTPAVVPTNDPTAVPTAGTVDQNLIDANSPAGVGEEDPFEAARLAAEEQANAEAADITLTPEEQAAADDPFEARRLELEQEANRAELAEQATEFDPAEAPGENIFDPGQTFNAGTTTKVTSFGTTGDAVTYYWDTASCWDNTNKRFIPNVAGYYYFNTGLAIASLGTGENLGLAFFKNGTGIRYTSYFNNGGANDVYLNASCVMYMNGSTDYAEVYFSNGSGTSMNLRGEQYASWFTGFLARAA